MSWLRNATSRLATNTLSGARRLASDTLSEARRLASNTLSGARRLASNIIPEPVQRRITDFGNWLTRHVGPDQTPQVLDEITESIRTNYPPRQPFEVREGNSALRNFARVYTVDGIEGVDARTFLDRVRENITRVLRNNRGTKVKLIFKCGMERPSTLGETVIKPANFSSEIHINLDGTDEVDIYITMVERILENMAVFQSLGSGWRLYNIIKLELHTVSYTPLRGETWIALPKELANKNAIINMRNTDNKCFLWCVLRALNPKDNHPERIDKKLKEMENTLNMDGIEYPVSLKDIDKFEKQNPTISITVFSYNEKNKVFPLRVSKYAYTREVNILLMLIEKVGVKHYTWVKNISRLLSSQVSNHREKHHFCLRCLNPFWCHKSLEKHLEYCRNYEAVKIEMPKKGKNDILKFKNYCNSEKVPFIIYADTESLIKLIQTCEADPEKSYTKKYQKHEPISFSYYIKCFDDNVFEPVLRSYTGEDAMQKFVEWLEKDVKEIANIPAKKIIFKEEETDRFNKATNCWICKGELGEDKVRDHCHYTGKYRGAAHNECNLKYRKPKFTPVVFHNLSGYDSHLFIKNLGFNDGNIDCIPNNDEKNISFTKNIKVGTYVNNKKEAKPINHKIRFIDSFKFMPASLDSLVNNLPEDALNNLKKYHTGDKLNLVKRKGVYPYEYMDSLERFKETKLPPKEAFYSKLNNEDISDEDHTHAEKVWDTFEMKNLQDYHNLYNETDVLQLADVFENFRNICMENYKLDPAYYFTAPGLAWDACLKITDVELELLTDIDMLLMFEKGIRGGVSMISNRYGKANNKYMGDKFNPSEPSKYLVYLDANNLYGYAMSKKLPTRGFKWMNDRELNLWEKIPCILEVSLEYPEKLHDLHNDYPLAPERINCDKVEKLIPNLQNKEKYVIHYENLKQYLDLGIKLTPIYRGIKFEESEWLKTYIDLNTNLRAKAKNNFEKDFFKLMNNSVFGKTMENIRNRVNIK